MEWLNYHHLYYFWMVRQAGSFTKAAEKLSISQSVVSEQIAQLEKSLGVQLFDRTHKKTPQLTETGLVVLDYAQAIFETGQEMLRWVKTTEHRHSKQIRIGIQSGLSRSLQMDFIRPILGSIEHKIDVVTGDQERLLKLLNDYKIDVILMSTALDERFSFQSYAHMMSSSPVVVVSSKNIKKTVKEAFNTIPCYLPSVTLEIRVQINAYFERHKIKPIILGDVDDIALLRLLALESEALVAIPRGAVLDDLNEKKIHQIHEFKDIRKIYYAITRERRFPNPLTAELIEKLKKE